MIISIAFNLKRDDEHSKNTTRDRQGDGSSADSIAISARTRDMSRNEVVILRLEMKRRWRWDVSETSEVNLKTGSH